MKVWKNKLRLRMSRLRKCKSNWMHKRRRLRLLDNSQALIVELYKIMLMEDMRSPINQELLITDRLTLEVEQYTAVEDRPSTMLELLTIAAMLLADLVVARRQRVSTPPSTIEVTHL